MTNFCSPHSLKQFEKCFSRPYSWDMALKTCKDKGWHLPEFKAGKEQEKLMQFLKDSNLVSIEALYIGLRKKR